MIATRVLKIDPSHIDEKYIKDVADALGRGGLVVFPTETVYGVGVNLLDKRAVERLAELKKRPEHKQFSLHIADKDDVEKYAVNILPRAYKIMERFWPGPLTIVLSAPNDKTVGIRFPDNEIALRLLSRVDFPVVATSANLPDEPAPTNIGVVLKDLNGLVDVAIDAGLTKLGVESTVVDCRALPFKILREGYIKTQEFFKVADTKTILFVCTGNSCRSVMAEYILKKKLQVLHKDNVEVISAGTMALSGMSPTHETVKLVQELGLDASGHKAQRVSSELIKSADLILAMETRHEEDLVRHFPREASRIHLFGKFVRLEHNDAEVSDPIGRTSEFYKECFFKISHAVDRLAGLL